MIATKLASAVAMFAFAALASAAAQPEYEMDAVGTVEIGADGLVRDYQQRSNVLAPKIAELVEHNVRTWKFNPIIVDGNAVAAKTTVRLHLKAVPSAEADRYTVRIDNVIFGEPKTAARMTPPKYPASAVSAHVAGRVVLSLRLDESGGVAEALPYQTSLSVRTSSEQEAQRWRKVLEDASIRATRSWHYDLAETLNGKPVGTSLRVPFTFNLCAGPCARGSTDSTWKAYFPGPVHPAPWSNSAAADAGHDLDTAKDGEALAVESRFQLAENVVGKTL
jgi:hypothetical protein